MSEQTYTVGHIRAEARKQREDLKAAGHTPDVVFLGVKQLRAIQDKENASPIFEESRDITGIDNPTFMSIPVVWDLDDDLILVKG